MAGCFSLLTCTFGHCCQTIIVLSMSAKKGGGVEGWFSLFTCTFGHCCHTIKKLEYSLISLYHCLAQGKNLYKSGISNNLHSRTMPRLCLKQTAAERFGQSHLFGAGDRMSQDGTKKKKQSKLQKSTSANWREKRANRCENLRIVESLKKNTINSLYIPVSPVVFPSFPPIIID